MDRQLSIKGFQQMSAMDCLPTEIATNILSLLPVKSVFRCRSVCKTWCSTIDNPYFVTLHYSNSSAERTDHPFSLILNPYYYIGQLLKIGDYDLASSENDEQSIISYKTSRINLPFHDPYGWLLAGHCKGLFYFCAPYFTDSRLPKPFPSMYIYNPSTRDYANLPEMTLPDFYLLNVASSFGFGQSIEKFKVVHVFCWDQGEGETSVQVLVHTLGSNSWRVIEDVPDYLHDDLREITDGCVKGHVHWFSELNKVFVSFDLEFENFEVIPVPPESRLCTEPYYSCVKAGVVGGFLWISDCYCCDDGINDYVIWVMKEYNVMESWTKQFVIRNGLAKELNAYEFIPISFGKDGKVVLLCDSMLLCCYDVETKKGLLLETVPIFDLNYDPTWLSSWFQAFPYIESLISPCKLMGTVEEINA